MMALGCSMTAMAPSLERFFEHMVPFLEGRTNAGQLSDVLGPSASGLKRLTFYRTLICRDTAWIIGGLFPATRSACDLHQAGLWEDLVTRYSREYHPLHWDPNPFGAQFAEYIEARAESGEPIPSYLYETADYEWISYATGVAPDLSPANAEDIGLDRTLFVRHYAHNIPQFACRAEGSDSAAAPEEPCTVLVYRHVHTLASRYFYPNKLGLLALARRNGKTVFSSEVSEVDVDAAEQQLVELGILWPRATVTG